MLNSSFTSLKFQDMQKLIYLNIGGSQIESLVSLPSALKHLHATCSKLRQLKLDKSSQLIELHASDTNLAVLVNIPSCIQVLNVSRTPIAAMDIAGCVQLIELYVGSTKLTNLNVSNQKKMKHVKIAYSLLEAFDNN